jgi:ATP phosphoribosyltransferase
MKREKAPSTRLTLALPRGRLFQPSWDLLRRAALVSEPGWGEERTLVYEASPRGGAEGLRIIRVRDVDVPTYVEHGAADLGVVGKDLLLEQAKGVYEPLDLRFGLCRLVLAAPKEEAEWSRLVGRAWLRVATKFPRITEEFFGQQGVPVDVVRLSGAVELAPALGLADAIVDLVDPGRTLRENGLEEVREVLRASARLIVNRASQKTRYSQIRALVERLREHLKP